MQLRLVDATECLWQPNVMDTCTSMWLLEGQAWDWKGMVLGVAKRKITLAIYAAEKHKTQVSRLINYPAGFCPKLNWLHSLPFLDLINSQRAQKIKMAQEMHGLHAAGQSIKEGLAFICTQITEHLVSIKGLQQEYIQHRAFYLQN